jgi:VWFA-related protein
MGWDGLGLARVATAFLACVLLAGDRSVTAQTPSAPPKQGVPSSVAGPSPVPPASTAGAPTSPSTPVFKSTAALVLLDVVVTNPAGAVHGIARSQFHVVEDGKEQKLIAMEEHIAPNPAAISKPAALPAHIYTDAPEGPASSAVNVLLLDGLNTPMGDQMYVRQEMLSYLKNIPPGARIAIFTLASRLRIVQGFTADPAPLLAALSSKKGTPSQSVLLDDPNDTSMSDMSDQMAQLGATADAMSSLQQFQADLAAEQMDLRVRTTLDALQQLARYLRGVPGRKNLIWFSGSFPLNIDPDATLQSPFEAMRNYAEDIRETSSMLSASRVAVYPVDARGLMVDPQFSAQKSGSGMSSQSGGGASSGGGRRGGRGSMGGGSLMPSQPKFAQNSSKFAQQQINEHATMRQIAEETGGEAFYDSNALKSAVALAIQNGSDYYTLAYVPDDKADDGRFHKIKVTLPDAPSYRLSYRSGYVTESAKTQVKNGQVPPIVAASMRGAPSSSEIVFKVRVLPLSDPALKGAKPQQAGTAGDVSPKVKGPLQRYWIDYAADLHGASLSETPEGLHQASLEFVAIAYDRDGQKLNMVDKGYSVSLSSERFDAVLQKGLQIHQEIDLPAGEIYLRTLVHDMNNDRIGAVEIPLVVKPAGM